MDGFTDDPKKIEWARTIWLAASGLLLGYEAFALATKRKLLSEAVWELSKDYPLLPFAAGFINGHFFWQRTPPSPKVTVPSEDK